MPCAEPTTPCGARALAHLDETGESDKLKRIADIVAAGRKPRIDIVAYGLEDEATALRIEAAVIDVLWPGKKLTNRVRGHKSFEFGRVALEELNFQHSAKPVVITDPVLLIRINRLYRPGMSELELYEVTRGVWTCGSRREKARYALAVYQGVVREIYEIVQWHKSGTLKYATRTQDLIDPRRWEFTGKVATGPAAKYRGGAVDKYFSKGAQLPFTYVNC